MILYRTPKSIIKSIILDYERVLVFKFAAGFLAEIINTTNISEEAGMLYMHPDPSAQSMLVHFTSQ